MAISKTGQVSYSLDDLIKFSQIDQYFGDNNHAVFQVLMAQKRLIIENMELRQELSNVENDFELLNIDNLNTEV